MKSLMECERSVITMTLFWFGYLVYNLDNYAMTLPTETSLSLDDGGAKQTLEPGSGDTKDFHAYAVAKTTEHVCKSTVAKPAQKMT